jgi:hypothetical protein
MDDLRVAESAAEPAEGDEDGTAEGVGIYSVVNQAQGTITWLRPRDRYRRRTGALPGGRTAGGAAVLSILDVDHLPGDGVALVAEKVGDDIGDAVRCTGLVHLGRHGVDRDVTLTEFESERSGERGDGRYGGRLNAVGRDGGVSYCAG